MTDLKSDAQRELVDLADRCPAGVYRHHKGGLYVVFNHSVDEATLCPLVHYYSFERATRWTRTIANFMEVVDGKPRFKRMRDASRLELHVARSGLR